MRFLISSLLIVLLAQTVQAQAACGGSFASFIRGIKTEARSLGYSRNAVDQFFDGAAQDPKVLKADRAQGVFQMPFVDFSRRLISQNRIDTGRAKAAKYSHIFDQMEAEYGVSRGVLLAFWAFETDYGGYQGNFNTLNALLTLAHDCRRPQLFRPQVFSALELFPQRAFRLTVRTVQPLRQESIDCAVRRELARVLFVQLLADPLQAFSFRRK